jgi:tetratricopeptide (TPR) repeat protein
VIDLDRMEAQLSAALTEEVGPITVRAAAAPAPAPTPAPATPRVARQRRPSPAPVAVGVTELMELGLVEEADARIAATTDRLDQTTWATMRALLDGRRDGVKMGVESLSRMGQDGNRVALDLAWALRFWLAFEWGTQDERLDALDHCRERAYRFDELMWWGNLTLLLAALGKQDEGVRAFDQALPLAATASPERVRLDVVTNLIEAATFLGDAGRVALAGRHLRTETGRLVMVGAGVVCKGSVDRYLGLIHAAVGQGREASDYFRSAEAAHRSISAAPLLARTVQQARSVLAAA